MRAPVNVVTSGEIAWNSFGFVARDISSGEMLLASEPNKVGIRSQPLSPAVYGDLVWNDVDKDGIQDGGEPGVKGVRVELYKDDGDGIQEPGTGDNMVSFTVTSDGGLYIFPNLPAGNYTFCVIDQNGGISCDNDSLSDIVSGITELDRGSLFLSPNPVATYLEIH